MCTPNVVFRRSQLGRSQRARNVSLNPMFHPVGTCGGERLAYSDTSDWRRRFLRYLLVATISDIYWPISLARTIAQI